MVSLSEARRNRRRIGPQCAAKRHHGVTNFESRKTLTIRQNGMLTSRRVPPLPQIFLQNDASPFARKTSARDHYPRRSVVPLHRYPTSPSLVLSRSIAPRRVLSLGSHEATKSWPRRLPFTMRMLRRNRPMFNQRCWNELLHAMLEERQCSPSALFFRHERSVRLVPH